MKFTLSWLKTHLETDRSVHEIAEIMTMAGLEVEHVEDPAERLRPFTAARVVRAEPHPNADRLRVCQVETVDGMKEIVCGAPNARAGLCTIYAPIGAYVPGLGVRLQQKPVRGVVSDGMLCSAKELEVAEEADGIVELPPETQVGAPAAEIFGADPLIDFEVTPNRPDWLGVYGIARDLAAAGAGRFRRSEPPRVAAAFPSPIRLAVDGLACRQFAGRLVRDVQNRPSPDWLQRRLRSVGLRPISALVDVTNFLAYDRARPLHVYDADKIVGGRLEARLGRPSERLAALDGRTYAISEEMCVIADGSGAVGLGGVMGGESTGCSETTRNVFIESAWFDPLRTAQTGRDLALFSDAQYRFARGVDPRSLTPGLEFATALILEMCGGEASDIVVAGEALPDPEPILFDPSYVHRLTGLPLTGEAVLEILGRLEFRLEPRGARTQVTPPSFRRDVEGAADLVEEAARIAGFDQLPSTPLPRLGSPPGGVLTPKQARVRIARRALAALGYSEIVSWSFTSRARAGVFGGGEEALVIDNPIASDLDAMRPSILPNLIEAEARNRARGLEEAALFEIGPVFSSPEPEGQRTAVAGLLSAQAPRRWDGGGEDPLYRLKGDLFELLEELGAPASALQIHQGELRAWWSPGRAARLQLGPKTRVAEFGALHPRALKALGAEGPLYGFELILEALPEARRKSSKARPPLRLSPFMPVRRDFAFVVEAGRPAGDLVRAAQGADRGLISAVRVFDVYQGPGVPEGSKSLALEVTLQPQEKTLTDADIEALSTRILAAVEKATGARLRR